MIKKILSGLLCAVLCVSILTACSDPANSTADSKKAVGELLRPLTVRAPKKYGEMTATFLNTETGETWQTTMTISEEDDCNIFRCEADVNKYNMVHFTNDGKDSMDVAFNSFISGWNVENDMLLPYTVGEKPVYDPQFETKTFQFDGRDKNVYIWTPEDYDEKAQEKYSVIYMFDGQSVLATGRDRGMDNDMVCWNVSEHLTSMMDVTENKAILVAVDNGDAFRMDELVPDLGEINMEGEPENVKAEDLTEKRGSAFADFLCDTVMPYINEHYHVHTDAKHTALAGSSLGGLETFYTVLSHPDKFGTGGVMSATFDMYAEKEWTAFLKDKLKMKNAPFLYFYAGSYHTDNGNVTETMYNDLIEKGYAKEKLVFSKYESGEHLIDYWRSIYPEFLEAVFTQNVSALSCGVPVQYEDTTDPLEKYLEELDLDPNDITPGYVYYDNSETKWDKVYAYWWGGLAFNSFTRDPYYFAEWPGFEMERLGSSDIYRVVAPWGNTGIIFDSGVTDKEVAQGKTAFQTTDIPYTNDLIGKLYKIDMSVDPTPDPGNMKTKSRYSAGAWSDYSE